MSQEVGSQMAPFTEPSLPPFASDDDLLSPLVMKSLGLSGKSDPTTANSPLPPRPDDPSQFDNITSLSPAMVARLEQIVTNFKDTASSSALSNGRSAASNGGGGGSGGGSTAAADDAALALEKRRHEDTKRLLASTEARLESMLEELDDRNGDLEGFRVDARDLKDQLEAAAHANDALRKKLAAMAGLEQDMARQVETVHALDARLRMEMEGRHAVEVDLAASRRDHAQDKLALEASSRAVRAANGLLEAKADEARELLQRLDAANKRVAARDRMLQDAEAEKRALQATVFDARHNIEETAAVFGEASLAFNTEVDRLMGTLLSMKLSVAPRPASTPPRPAAAAGAAPSTPTPPPRTTSSSLRNGTAAAAPPRTSSARPTPGPSVTRRDVGR